MNEALTSLDGRDIGWRPLPKQALALKAPVRELLYGGEKGGGKTEFLVVCWWPLLALAAQKFATTGQPQHKCRIVVFRRNLDDLKDIIAKSHYIYPLFDGDARWHENEKTWTFGSRATVTYRHLDGPNDYLAYNGQEIPGIGFDQVEQIHKHEYAFIAANCRSGDPDYMRERMIRCTANPGGEDWILTHFAIPREQTSGAVVRVHTELRDGSIDESTRVFIRAHLRENPHLPASYEGQLRGLYNEDQVAMYLEGDFYRVASSYFSGLLRPEMHFCKSKPVPESWEFRFAIDWGASNPACVLIGALDEDGCLWVIDELHEPGVTGEIFGEKMARMWARQSWVANKRFELSEFWGVIDKQAFDNNGSKSTAGAGIVKAGFRLFEAKKDRAAGCEQMRARLVPDVKGKPRLRVFSDRCPHVVRALQAIPSNAPEDPDDYAKKSKFAHAADTLRFLCMEFPVENRPEEDPRDETVRKWDEYLRRAREKQRPEADA